MFRFLLMLALGLWNRDSSGSVGLLDIEERVEMVCRINYDLCLRGGRGWLNWG